MQRIEDQNFLLQKSNGHKPRAAHPSVTDLAAKLQEKFTALWWDCDSSPPDLGSTYTRRDQITNEKHLKRFLEILSTELENPPQTKSLRAASQEKILSSFGGFAKAALGFQDRHLNILLSPEVTEMTVEFPAKARRFDPNISGMDISQANRNTWAMHGVQLLMGLPVALTPSVFAYSMLYPYTDNYLDDPAISSKNKRTFNQRLARRLAGESISPTYSREKIIYDLVGMIESEYDRGQYPQVFDSLLAIHHAQTKSLRLHRPDAAPFEVDVLGISIEKGGTSVMADGYLVAGDLTQAQAEFFYGYGAFLQIEDDLQDVNRDHEAGILTLFSQSAGRWPLNSLTNRTINFGFHVLETMEFFDNPKIDALKELLIFSAILLPVEAAGNAGRYYSRRYIKELEAHSPFRFGFLRKLRRNLARKETEIIALIEAYSSAG